ncbi:hypothetical protein KCP75_09635 [Salmonella enterica subsp. enterica]|nr:hypothetical protein KCP75_09635 [Salmonella enterica subsp. enterica]
MQGLWTRRERCAVRFCRVPRLVSVRRGPWWESGGVAILRGGIFNRVNHLSASKAGSLRARL